MRSDGASMEKKKKNMNSWLVLLKRFFISKAVSKPEKEKKRRWVVLGRHKNRRLASIEAPEQEKTEERSLSEAEEEQSKHAMTVAIATAAAAEVAVAAAHAAADVVWLSVQQCECDYDKVISNKYVKFQDSRDGEALNIAATRVQTAFRGYLARKALRALKGLVRLQAIIRGRAVRRQAMTTLKCLQSIVSIQSQICARRSLMADGTNKNWHSDDGNAQELLQDPTDKEIIKIESKSERRWDDSLMSKEEANALFLSKREALIKRERIKEYTLIHRRSTESEENKGSGRLRYWLEHWVDTQLAKREDFIKPDCSSESRIREQLPLKGERRQLSLRISQKQNLNTEERLLLQSPRRSFHHRKQWSVGEDDSSAVMGSPTVAIPTYMAATESARARARSLSSPRLRPINIDAYSDTTGAASPYKHRLSPVSSISSCRMGSFHNQQQQIRSPCLKSVQGPVKSKRMLKDLSFDSECSSQNWDNLGGLFR